MDMPQVEMEILATSRSDMVDRANKDRLPIFLVPPAEVGKPPRMVGEEPIRGETPEKIHQYLYT